jgi:Protein of unknown function (DUF2934)
MIKRSEEPRTSTAESGNPGLDDRIEPGLESEEIEEASETAWDEDQAPSPDEIRLRAYYRYMERQGGDDDGDEIADWLAAESELRQPRDAAAERRDEQP